MPVGDDEVPDRVAVAAGETRQHLRQARANGPPNEASIERKEGRVVSSAVRLEVHSAVAAQSSEDARVFYVCIDWLLPPLI
eukprot:8226973-Alexandrium_andersonii.AAC.1